MASFEKTWPLAWINMTAFPHHIFPGDLTVHELTRRVTGVARQPGEVLGA